MVRAVSRRLLAWVLAVPLILAGVEGGHWLAYRIIYPSSNIRAQVLAASGHGYLIHAPLFLAAGAAVVLCAFGLRVSQGGRAGSVETDVSLLPFVLAAPLAFALQECIEQALVGSWPFGAALAPTFMPGLVFQLPFALLAFLLARWLLRTAERIGAMVLGSSTVPATSIEVARPRGLRLLDTPRPSALSRGHSGRGPPPALGPARAAFRQPAGASRSSTGRRDASSSRVGLHAPVPTS